MAFSIIFHKVGVKGYLLIQNISSKEYTVLEIYHIGGMFRGEKFSRILCFRKIIHRKQKIYMVHTLFLTDSQNFNHVKYTTYMV